ncbi:hypothetical protein NXX40_16255 [Parabacteroides distasonis]|nr:hypothetical protein [Parabacteroides distasonis]
MRGELYIDGKDAYTDFGVWITEGGYDGLLPFPELVEPDRNDPAGRGRHRAGLGKAHHETTGAQHHVRPQRGRKIRRRSR